MSKHSILVVDDMVSTIEAVVNFLERSGENYQIYQATNGKMAYKIVQKKLPDLVLMDWEMPVMNGLESLKLIKQNEATKDINVIMLTAISSSENLKRALEYGAIDYIKKPIDEIELLARIKTSLIISDSSKKIKDYSKNLELHKEEILAQNEELNTQKEEIEKQAEELKKINKNLVELNNFKEAVLGMTVHDLKNPLNTIIGLSENNATVQQAGKQMLDLVQNIIDLHKFEQSKINIEVENRPINLLVNKAIKQIEYLCIQKNIKIINNIKIDYNVFIDYELIRRCIINILYNSIKYSNHNSNIYINVFDKEESNLFLNLKLHENQIAIIIRDSGEKIDLENPSDIYNKYTQVKTKISGKGRNANIGFTFCKHVVEAHKGEVGAASTTNENNVNENAFWLTIPIGINKNIKYIEKENQEREDKKINLDKSDRDYLYKHIDELKKYEVYDISSVKQIFKNIDNKSINIEIWLKELKNAVNSCNEEYYNKLLNI